MQICALLCIFHCFGAALSHVGWLDSNILRKSSHSEQWSAVTLSSTELYGRADAPTSVVEVELGPVDYSWEEYFIADGFRADSFKKEVNGRMAIVDIGPSGTYGEIPAWSMSTVLAQMKDYVDGDDIMYDLGSGTGKIPAQFAFETKIGKCIGIELGDNRHRGAVASLSRMKSDPAFADKKEKYDKLEYRQGSVTIEDWSDCTVMFLNAPAFTDELYVEIEHIIPLAKNMKVMFVFERNLVTNVTEERDIVTLSNGLRFRKQILPCPGTWSDDVVCNLYIKIDDERLIYRST